MSSSERGLNRKVSPNLFHLLGDVHTVRFQHCHRRIKCCGTIEKRTSPSCDTANHSQKLPGDQKRFSGHENLRERLCKRSLNRIVVTPLQDQNLFPSFGQLPGNRCAPGATASDDRIVFSPLGSIWFLIELFGFQIAFRILKMDSRS